MVDVAGVWELHVLAQVLVLPVGPGDGEQVPAGGPGAGARAVGRGQGRRRRRHPLRGRAERRRRPGVAQRRPRAPPGAQLARRRRLRHVTDGCAPLRTLHVTLEGLGGGVRPLRGLREGLFLRVFGEGLVLEGKPEGLGEGVDS